MVKIEEGVDIEKVLILTVLISVTGIGSSSSYSDSSSELLSSSEELVSDDADGDATMVPSSRSCEILSPEGRDPLLVPL
jgi:hypothetical protein